MIHILNLAPGQKSMMPKPKTLPLLLVSLTVLGLTACSKGPVQSGSTPEMIKPKAPPGFMNAGDSDPELIAVKEKAQNQLSEFTSAFAKKTAKQQFLIKAPFRGPI